MRMLWRKYKSFSGPLVRPDKGKAKKIDQPNYTNSSFLQRALWLTSMVECGGKFGLINMYDGTAITAGLHQAALVLPRSLSKQGPLYKVLWRMNQANVLGTGIYQMLIDHKWKISPTGLIEDTGCVLRPEEIRNTLTPTDGQVSQTGLAWQQSSAWAKAFFETFSDPKTFDIQISLGEEHLIKRITKFKSKRFFDKRTLQEVAFYRGVYDRYPFYGASDLVHAAFMSFVVNAPSWAYKAYDKTLKELDLDVIFYDDDELFGRALIKNLCRYSKWDDDRRNGRYQRTRRYAMKVWPEYLFEDDGVMPKDIPG